MGEWIAAAESRAAELGPWQVANLREIQRGYVRATALPTALVAVRHAAMPASELETRLRRSDPPVIGRIQDDRVLLDLRTVLAEQDARLLEILSEV